VAKDLTKTDIVGNGTSYSDNEAITAIELRNPETDAGLYAIRYTDPTSNNEQSLRLSVRTSAGNFTVPTVSENGKISLNGHVAKILVTDFSFGGGNLVHSTAEVLTYGDFDSRPTLALWASNGEGGEFFIKGAKSGSAVRGDASKVQFVKSKKGLVVNFKEQAGMTVVTTDNDVRVHLMDHDTAHLFWVPALTADPICLLIKLASSPSILFIPHFLTAGSVFVQGPHLVRAAQLEGRVISLRGD
jgi:beta-galactosidase